MTIRFIATVMVYYYLIGSIMFALFAPYCSMEEPLYRQIRYVWPFFVVLGVIYPIVMAIKLITDAVERRAIKMMQITKA